MAVFPGLRARTSLKRKLLRVQTSVIVAVFPGLRARTSLKLGVAGHYRRHVRGCLSGPSGPDLIEARSGARLPPPLPRMSFRAFGPGPH